MKWEVVCFDLDDTIIDYEQTFKRAIQHCFLHFVGNDKEDISFEKWFLTFKQFCDLYWDDYQCKRLTRTEYRRRRFLDTMAIFQLEANTNLADEFHHYFDNVVSRFAVPMNGIVGLLHRLHHLSIKMGIITNGTSKVQQNKVYYLGLSRFFPEEVVIVSDELGVEKPNPAIFHYALDKIAPKSQYRLYIGDSWELDVVGALGAKWQAIYFNTRNQPPTTAHQPLAICNNVDELASSLFSIVSIQ
jgi:5'-nucleotidase